MIILVMTFLKVLKPGAGEDEYKEYMRLKYEYETYENDLIRLARKLRAENRN